MSFIQEAVREWTFIVGRENSDQAWLLSDYDTWERNPFYDGPKVRHPEDYDEELDLDQYMTDDYPIDEDISF
jgi:hypothetical protein